MIIKSFEIEKIKLAKNDFILLYGSNEGHKTQIIKELLVNIRSNLLKTLLQKMIGNLGIN